MQAELEQLRQRLRFYEGFDRIIQDNISRAGELLRAAEEERTLAARELTAARQETTRSAQRQRTLLIDLAAEAQALSRRMLDAVDALPGDVTTTEPGSPAESTRTAPSDEPVDAAAVAIAAPTSGHTAGDVDAGPLATATADGPRAMTVIVHGVPDARAALSLQRHLAQLAGPGTVLAREFMGGIARFEVTGNAITFDDLRRWDGGEALRPVHLLPDVVEVAAPGAAPG
ncbi:MAG TPA: hypothetical protein VFU81_12055 [Thermomicrobiales bacterium]|nr:hypothetical protein [Thermomicrobiales bacterium]